MGPITLADAFESILPMLSLEEKISLLAARDWWRTPVINRDGVFIPHIKSTDGPNGARGESYVSGIKAACFPCGTSLGASFDPELVHRIGRMIACEAVTKSAHILLAPTLNVIRHPLGGRNYETFSEDPVVLGKLAAAFVNGCQSEGVAATPKHFVANDAENQRKTLSVEIDEQTLREIYMLPFQLVLKYSEPWCFMTSYNKVNGTYVSDDARLVNCVLRKEWGFKGLVVSDWMGVYSTTNSINAGVDLEMPGPTKLRGQHLLKAVRDGLVQESTIEASAGRVLDLAKRLKRFEDPSEPPERALDNPARDQAIAEAAAEGMVLLKNDDILPISRLSSIALIGHHSVHASLGGGGSARVDALHAVSPSSAMRDAGFDVRDHKGVPVFGALPHADPSVLFESGGIHSMNPVKIEWFNSSIMGDAPVHETRQTKAEYMIKEQWPHYLSKAYCTRMSFAIRPSTSGKHTFSIISTGRALCRINGEMVTVREQETDLNPESFYFFKSKIERRFAYLMNAGDIYDIVLESWGTPEHILEAPPLNGRMFQGSALRFYEEINVQQCLSDAAQLAASSNVAVICVGTTDEIESEGFDREDLQLSSHQYELIDAVMAANPRTCVVNFSGGAINFLPFVDKVPAIVQAWFPGQECGHSLVKILSGDVNPSGRLPFSWPRRVEDSSAHGNFPAKDNHIRYGEGLDVGYRWHDRVEAPDPLFPFGYGLSYTTFEVSDVECNAVMHDGQVKVSCLIKNTGTCVGKAVVQIYVRSPQETFGRRRPNKELKDFVKVSIEPGQQTRTITTLDKYAVSIYDAEHKSWIAREGLYEVLVGTSSDQIAGTASFVLQSSFDWVGV